MNDTAKSADFVDRLAWADLVEGAPAPLRRSLGLAVERIGSAIVLSSTGLSSLFFNRAIGLASEDLDQVRRALRHFTDRGVERYLLQIESGPRDAELLPLLESCGVERFRLA